MVTSAHVAHATGELDDSSPWSFEIYSHSSVIGNAFYGCRSGFRHEVDGLVEGRAGELPRRGDQHACNMHAGCQKPICARTHEVVILYR